MKTLIDLMASGCAMLIKMLFILIVIVLIGMFALPAVAIIFA